MDLPGLMAAIEEFLEDQLDGAKALEITIHLKDAPDFHAHYFSPRRRRRETLEPIEEQRGEKLQRSAARVTVEKHKEEEEAVEHPPYDPHFEPNEYQDRIYTALEYRGLRAEELIEAVGGGDRRRLWKPGGIKELIAAGWVRLDKKYKLGYYRPDAPPEEIASET